MSDGNRAQQRHRYLTSIDLQYHGSAALPVSETPVVTKPNPLGLPVDMSLGPFVESIFSFLKDQEVSTEIEMPAQLEVGVSIHASGRIKIFGDYHWVDWSSFDRILLDFANPSPQDEELVQNYRDTSGIRVGLEFSASETVRLSAGYIYNQAAAPDETVTPTLPEAERNHFTAGIGWDAHPRWSIHAAYQFIDHSDRRGRVVNPPPGELPTVALNTGVYRSRGNMLGIMMTFKL